ncbi:MAG TPA: condensation domain-containing protein, partial [Thermoanaerobaculia bacterium]
MKSPLVTDLTPADHYSMLELPADRPRPPVSSFRGATRAVRLPAAVTASLRQVAGREGVSLDVLLLAGLAALLARYSGAEDLVIGAAGPTSLLPLRIQWTGDRSFKQLVAAADGALSAALAKADPPFEAPLQVLFAGPGASGEPKLAVD